MRNTILFRTLTLTAITMSTLSVQAQNASLSLYDLTCNNQTNPVGIDVPEPVFSWKLKSGVRGAHQTAYQLLVATKPELLTPDGADLWNTQQVKTNDTLRIPYKGKPLSSNQQVYWMVRSWDAKDAASLWSEPAIFTTALLDKKDWHAQWISTQGEPQAETNPISSANWIWSHADQNDGATPDKIPGGAVRYFRKTFQLPASAKSARIYITADNKSSVLLNNKPVLQTSEWAKVTETDIAGLFTPGKDNTIEVRVENEGDKPNAAGLVLTLTANDETTRVFQLVTDATWQSSPFSNAPEWKSASPDEQPKWQEAHVLGAWGITPWHKVSEGQPPILPAYRKSFTPGQPVRHALLHVTGLGHYSATVNGKPVSNHFLDPAWTVTSKTVYYNTFDVTDKLTSATNTIGVLLGKGFYNTQGDRRIHGVHTNNPLALIAQLELTLQDGTTTRVATDASWKWAPGPLTHNAILGGSDYDARVLPDNWNTPDYSDTSWKSAIPIHGPSGVLVPSIAPPMRPLQEFQPKSIEEPEKGQFVYDFGQNCSATPRVTVNGPAGSTIKLVWAEQRKGQDAYTNNGKGPVIQSGIGHGHLTYTLKGGGQDETFFSDLFYTGYQYLELTGGVPEGQPNPHNLPVVKNITSVHVRTDQPPVGTFTTSNQMYNRIDTMIDWAVRSNLSHVFTDCPTREKLGWLEVPWLMWASTASRYDINNYAAKITRDITDSQLTDGQILTVAPAYPDFRGGFHYTPEWGAAGVFMPWYAHEWYDNSTILENNYTTMKKFVDYMAETSDKLIAAPGLGDWYDYLPGEPLGASRFTPPDLTATAVFAGCTDILTSTALLLDKSADAKKYGKLASEIRQAYNKRFRKGPGSYEHTSSPQTAHAISLVFNMVPTSERAQCAEAIVKDLEAREWQQTSGDIGYRFLINALSQTGHSDVIFKILNRDKIGSYAYLVNSGWTSLPEAWNANPTSSMNHCMLGHIQEWFTQHLVGIAPAPGSVGFDTILIQPTPGEGVTSARGSFNSPRGEISVQWKQENNTMKVDFNIPANSTGLVKLPVPETATITESGEAINPDSSDIKSLGYTEGRRIYQVPSGAYSFTATY